MVRSHAHPHTHKVDQLSAAGPLKELMSSFDTCWSKKLFPEQVVKVWPLSTTHTQTHVQIFTLIYDTPETNKSHRHH